MTTSIADYVLHEARREEQELIDPPFERSLDLLPRLATGRLTDAMTWLHTQPKVVTPVETGAQPKPEGNTK